MIAFIFSTFIILVSSGTSFGGTSPAGKEKCEHTETTFNCVRYLKNYDGDTATFDIPNLHPLIGRGISVRIKGIDTPEKNGKQPCEKESARTAQRLVENLLSQAQRIDLRGLERDKYFRILAEVWVDDRSLGDILIKNKLALSYDGGRKPADTNWCKK